MKRSNSLGGPAEHQPSEARTEARVDDDEIDVHRYFKALARRWPLLVAGAGVGVLTALLTVSRTPQRFNATATLMMPAEAPDPLTSSVVRGLLTLRPASDVVRELGLDRPPNNLTPEELLSYVTIDDVPGTRILRLTVRLGDPDAAAKAATVLANKLIERTRALSGETWASRRDSFTRQLEQLRGRLDAAERKVLDFWRSGQIALADRDAGAAGERRGELTRVLVDIDRERVRQRALQAERLGRQPAQTTRRSSSEGRAGAEAGAVTSATDKLEEDLVESRARVAELEQIRRQLTSVDGSSRSRRLGRFYELETELARLELERDVARRIYADVAARYGETSVQMEAGPPSLRMLDAAVPASQPIPRGTRRMLALGLIAGLALATLVIIAGEARRPHAMANARSR